MHTLRRGAAALARPTLRPEVARLTRAYAYASSSSGSTYVQSRPELPKPTSPSFFTGKSKFFDSIIHLENALSHHRRLLKDACLYPVPVGGELVASRTAWKNAEQLVDLVGTHLRIAQYRQVTGLLNELNELRMLAETAGRTDIEGAIAAVLQPFEREDKEAILGNKRRPVQFDEHGRSYTLGKRKESSARVWVVPTQTQASAPVSATNILINNTPLGAYFANVADRERVVLPFKLTGLVGAFNAFALARGGGTTGQAGAVAHGIAKALAAHVPSAYTILSKGQSILLCPSPV